MAEFFAFATTDGVNEIGVKVGNGSVEDFEVGITINEFVTDSLDKMGLAEAGATVEEKRVWVGAWMVDDTFGGGDGEVVVATDDEIIESIFLIEAGF